MRWQDKLNAAELHHVKETTVKHTLKSIKRNRIFQRTMVLDNLKVGYTSCEPCWTCRTIARKLGIE